MCRQYRLDMILLDTVIDKLQEYLSPKFMTQVILNFYTIRCTLMLSVMTFEKEVPSADWISEFLQVAPASLALYGFYRSIPWLLLQYLIIFGIYGILIVIGLIVHFVGIMAGKHIDSEWEADFTHVWWELFLFSALYVFFHYKVFRYYQEMKNAPNVSSPKRNVQKTASEPDKTEVSNQMGEPKPGSPSKENNKVSYLTQEPKIESSPSNQNNEHHLCYCQEIQALSRH